jgi:amino acid transporter
MKHLLWVVGLVALVPAFYFLNLFLNSPEDENTHYGVYAALCFVIALVLLGIFVFKKFREEGQQDISITKF